MLNSEACQSLKPVEKVLILLLHEQWRNDRPVSYGVREASKKIPCSTNTAGKSFKNLTDLGFIECVEESSFNSRLGSRARDWHLTWLPYLGNSPKNTWDKSSLQNKSTVSK